MVRRRQRRWEEDFAAWGRAGRIGPQTPCPTIRVDAPERARKGEPLRISWSCRGANRVRVCLTSPDHAERVLSDGRVRGSITLDALVGGIHRVVVRASPHPQLGPRAEAASATTYVEVVVPAPEVRLLAPASIELGDSARVAWEIENADTATLSYGVDVREVPSRGEFRLVPTEAGPLQLSLTAIGEGGQVDEQRQINVRVPELRIIAPTSHEATLGEVSRIDYEIRGASSNRGAVRLIPVDRPGEEQLVPTVGTIVIEDPICDETITLRATGQDGRILTHDIVVRVTLPEIDIDDELSLIWKE